VPHKLSEHFTLEELVFSQTASRRGIDNEPPAEIVVNLRRLAVVLEEVRALLDAPVLVSSGYRSVALNRAVGGAKNSAHVRGLAVDFTAPVAGTVLQVARRVAGSRIAYQQVIHEYGAWVHLGLAPEGSSAGREQLSIFAGTGYLDGLVTRPA
jgi:hypothetical protein